MTDSGTGIEEGRRTNTSCVSWGPSVQFIPTASAPASASVDSACGALSPNAVRPSERKVIPATIGISAESPRAARTASAASRRLPNVSSRSRSTPPSRSARICSSKISRTWTRVRLPYGLTRAPSGPTEPAMKARSPDADSRAIRTPSRLIFSSESLHSWAVSFTRLASQVLVVRIRAPASL